MRTQFFAPILAAITLFVALGLRWPWFFVLAALFVALALVGVHDSVIASGKILSGFTIASKLALGADLCNSARAMMMAIGCIQARRCNANDCPVGVATQKPGLVAGLDVDSKAERVRNFHLETITAFRELLGAAGLTDPSGLHRGLIHRRVSQVDVLSYAEIYPYLDPGALLNDPVPDPYDATWHAVDARSFMPR